MMAYDTLHKRLHGPIAKALKEELQVHNTLALPRLEKVVVNVGINHSKMEGKETQEYIAESLKRITGQKPVFTRARKAISNFKVRGGMVVGAVVTLRGKHMEEFLDRLISYALPRVRDFRGLNAKLDGHGNYSIGINDHSIFPEVPPVDARQIFGMQVTISTTAKDDKAAYALFKAMGVPFKPSKPEEKPAESAKKEGASVASKGDAPDTASSPSQS
ncbi:MAG: 50S ribosomal protein L5 [Candidatus Peribacteraceae bacterium]|nr:50S ribosomal protein L5 [Candidatus Peribacteraceae bacterium]